MHPIARMGHYDDQYFAAEDARRDARKAAIAPVLAQFTEAVGVLSRLDRTTHERSLLFASTALLWLKQEAESV